MNVNCSICVELLTPSADMTSVACGHVFHTHCILQWFESKKDCPQCRQKCRENQLRRIFFTEGVDTSMSQADPACLQDKIDSLGFNLRLAEGEKKKLAEEKDALEAKNVALREEFRRSERLRQGTKEELNTVKTKMQYLQAEKSKAERAVTEAEELRKKLDLYQAFDDIVRGSVADVNMRLHDIGDFSQASRELSILIVGLKKELEAQKGERQKYKLDLKEAKSSLSDLKKKLTTATRDACELRQVNRTLQADLRHCDEEKLSLTKKLRCMQEAIESPGGDVKSSAIKRMIVESPAPYLETQQPGEEDFLSSQSPTQGKENDKQSKRKDANQCGGGVPVLKKSRTMDLVLVSSRSSSTKGKANDELFYDGLGGHSKRDMFPDPLRPRNVLKLPRKKSKPCSGSKPKPSGHLNTINKYFDFDTP